MSEEKMSLQIAKDNDGDYHIYQAKNDKEICISKDVFQKVLELIPMVDECVENKEEGKWNLHDDWYLHISLFTLPKKKNKYLFKQNNTENGEADVENIKCIIHIRRWFTLADHDLPSREGLAFTTNTWKYFLEAVEAYKSKHDADIVDVDDSLWEDAISKKKPSNQRKRSADTMESNSKKKTSFAKNFTV